MIGDSSGLCMKAAVTGNGIGFGMNAMTGGGIGLSTKAVIGVSCGLGTKGCDLRWE